MKNSIKPNALEFLLAGKAIFTIHNLASGNHLTFKVVQKKASAPYFVSVLTGSNNETDYTYMGAIFEGRHFRLTRGSKIGTNATSYLVFSKIWERLVKNIPLPATIEICHEGKCGCCGRTLTTPESIERGIGPVCLQRTGLSMAA
jgi:hypothetical protein